LFVDIARPLLVFFYNLPKRKKKGKGERGERGREDGGHSTLLKAFCLSFIGRKRKKEGREKAG